MDLNWLKMIEHDISTFHHQIDADTTIVTPNRRLAATLLARYNDRQATTITAWQSPDILPLSTWMLRCWTQYVATAENLSDNIPTLISSTQEQLLWEKILHESKDTEHLLRLTETAEIAQSAYKTLSQWQLDVTHEAFECAEDYLALRTWINNYLALCKKNSWIDNTKLPDILSEKILNNEILLPKKICLIGFTEISPQLKYFLNACENVGCEIQHAVLIQDNIQIHRISLNDDLTEIEVMARWAKSIHIKNPQAIVGCVIPTLDKKRDDVARVFSEVFAENNLYQTDPHDAPYNLSAGKPLARYPIINMALKLLLLFKDTISRQQFSSILASPFVGDAEIERNSRSSVDRALRKANINSVKLSDLISEASTSKTLSLHTNCPKLAQRLQEYLKLCDGKAHTYHAWAVTFSEMLLQLGWPGERSLNSEEYQTVDAWMKLLSDFASLDYVSAPAEISTAWHTLRKMASALTFQPETPSANIQILGLLEAASLPFDYLWVAGMDDLAWPLQPNPNPFIPKALQREYQMPHATAEREYRFCAALTEQLIKSSRHVIFSHAEKREDLALHISPLLANLTPITLDLLQIPVYQEPAARLFHTRKIETFIDENGPNCSNETDISGGVDILKQQALCPFKAFATHRLHARELESPEPGLRAKDRGTLVHKLLEVLWNRIQDHAKLIAFDEKSLEVLINDAIEITLTNAPTAHKHQVNFLLLEKKRLYKLAHEWLTIEKSRPPFRVIATEKTEQIKLNKLGLTIRVDRIDELETGDQLIIDYKTGKTNDVNHWLDQRPDEPQLPIYTLINPDKTSAISFAQIHASKSCFKGVSRDETEIAGIRPIVDINTDEKISWRDQLTKWRDSLTQLADEFYRGYAKVDPKDGEKTCEYCALTSFCRIKESVIS